MITHFMSSGGVLKCTILPVKTTSHELVHNLQQPYQLQSFDNATTQQHSHPVSMFKFSEPASDVSTGDLCKSGKSLSWHHSKACFAKRLKSLNGKASRMTPICPDCALNNFHIAVLGRNQGKTLLLAAVHSVLLQSYPATKRHIWLFDDSSDDSETVAAFVELCGGEERIAYLNVDQDGDYSLSQWLEFTQALSTGDNFISCIRTNRHLGPAAAKYITFNAIAEKAGPNDVLLVVDGDDELSTAQALTIINKKYIHEGVWCTYGSYVGRWQDQTKPLPILNGRGPYMPRQELPQASWRYGHPRSFKVHLVKHFKKIDFQYSDGSWLLKATDRGFLYRVLELSGSSRIGYISQRIYKYKHNSHGSTLTTVPSDTKYKHLQYVLSLAPSAPLKLPVHVVLVLWKRILLLPDQLDQSLKQAETLKKKTGRTLTLHLINNNKQAVDKIDAVIAEFCIRSASANGIVGGCANTNNTQTFLSLSLVVKHKDKNWHAYSRFLYVNNLRRREPMDNVIFIDDDQLWPQNFIWKLAGAAAPRSSTGWYGKVWDVKAGAQIDYWMPSLQMHHLRKHAQPEVTLFKYGGPGGAVYSADLWLFDVQLLRLSRDLTKFYEFDDIWVSYVMDALLGWQMRRFMGPIPENAYESDDWLAKHSVEAGKSLRKMGTFTKPGVHERKTAMFNELQGTEFGWNISPNSVANDSGDIISSVVAWLSSVF